MDELILKLILLDARCLLRAASFLSWVLRALCEFRVTAPYWIITKAACDKYHAQQWKQFRVSEGKVNRLPLIGKSTL